MKWYLQMIFNHFAIYVQMQSTILPFRKHLIQCEAPLFNLNINGEKCVNVSEHWCKFMLFFNVFCYFHLLVILYECGLLIHILLFLHILRRTFNTPVYWDMNAPKWKRNCSLIWMNECNPHTGLLLSSFVKHNSWGVENFSFLWQTISISGASKLFRILGQFVQRSIRA